MLLSVASCGEKRPQQQNATDDEWFGRAVNTNRDSTLYGTCGDGSAMNSLQLITDNGDTLLLSTVAAKDAERVFGGYAVGDRMAVITDAQRTQALSVINVSSLMGDWVTVNPMDGVSKMGMSIRDGGIAESINQNDLVYRTWRLVNGSLELQSVRESGGDFEEVERFRIVYLTRDSLSLATAEDVYEYNRPSSQDLLIESYDGVDDEDEDDDLVF